MHDVGEELQAVYVVHVAHGPERRAIGVSPFLQQAVAKVGQAGEVEVETAACHLELVRQAVDLDLTDAALLQHLARSRDPGLAAERLPRRLRRRGGLRSFGPGRGRVRFHLIKTFIAICDACNPFAGFDALRDSSSVHLSRKAQLRAMR